MCLLQLIVALALAAVVAEPEADASAQYLSYYGSPGNYYGSYYGYPGTYYGQRYYSYPGTGYGRPYYYNRGYNVRPSRYSYGKWW